MPPPANDPRRRAAKVQWVVAGLVLAVGILSFSWAMAATPEQLEKAFESQRQQIQPPPGYSFADLARLGFSCVGVLAMGFAVMAGILAIFVRRGGRAAITFSTILSGLLMLILALQCIGALRATLAQPAVGLFSLAMVGGFTALVFAHIRLLQAAKQAGPACPDALAMQQMQYWMMQQQADGQAGSLGYGYGRPEPLPSPPQPQQPMPAKPPNDLPPLPPAA